MAATSSRRSTRNRLGPVSRDRKERAGFLADPLNLRRSHIFTMDALTIPCDVELRDSASGPILHGLILTEGRAGRRRAELFVPGSVQWPAEGISIRTAHLAPMEVRAVPVRGENGAISIAVPATPAIVSAVKAGRNRMSVEFAAIRENRTESGVREIERAWVDAAALSDDPEYGQTSAELRDRRPRHWWNLR